MKRDVIITCLITGFILIGCSSQLSNPTKSAAADTQQINIISKVEKNENLQQPVEEAEADYIMLDSVVDKEIRTQPKLDEGLELNGQSLIGQSATLMKKVESPKMPMEEKRHFGHSSVVPIGRRSSNINAMPLEPTDRENYANLEDNSIKRVVEFPVSTFSIDVDTGSYSNVRRMLREGRLPVQNAVRVEELINYFSYQYPDPKLASTPFSVSSEIAPAPWNPEHYLLQIGIKGFDVAQQALPAANLVFLLDVSGSMNSSNKLGLLKKSLRLLTQRMRSIDHISIVVYAGASGVVLQPTPGNDRVKILTALDQLNAGGSTNGRAGIRLAYSLAEQAFIPSGINRILLATDGDFNVGTVNFEALKDLVEEKRKTGISLTTLGFGTGNYNDHLMEQLADSGNGNYSYIDTLNEAQKVLVDEMASTLNTIAKDTKIQIEFNPELVAEYRLIGYENRALKREDFNNDNVDAGEIGAGHTVTALYEIALKGAGEQIEALRYGKKQTVPNTESNELAFLRLRYKLPDSDSSTLIEKPILKSDIIEDTNRASEDFRFSASVAAFGQLLKGRKYTQTFNFSDVLNLARNSRGADPFGYRGEFLQMVNLASSIAGENSLANMD